MCDVHFALELALWNNSIYYVDNCAIDYFTKIWTGS